MEWVTSWIQGIIVAVIIGTLIEMILPEGSNKKYIKIVIGIYILFSIISPAISKVTKNQFKLTDILNIDEYIQASKDNNYESLNKSQEDQIRTIYKNNLENDMKQKIENKGYKVINISLEIENDDEYTLKKVTLNIKKAVENKSSDETNTIVEEINQVKVEVNKNSETNEKIYTEGNETKKQEENGIQNKEQDSKSNKKEQLLNQEKESLKQYLSDIYQIEKDSININ